MNEYFQDRIVSPGFIVDSALKPQRCLHRISRRRKLRQETVTGVLIDFAGFGEADRLTLARVRKLMGVPMVQINIVSEGGQQVVSNA